MTLTNSDEIPADLPPGTYCCQLDESSRLGDLCIRFVTPPRRHEPGDCLVQIIKEEDPQ